MARETRERIARKGGEASHKNDSGRSSEGGSGSESGRGHGGSAGGREGEGQGVWYDEEAGQCRDDSGRFVECPPGMEGTGTRDDPNMERVASKGGEARGGGFPGGRSESSGGGRGGSSGGERGGSPGGRGGRG